MSLIEIESLEEIKSSEITWKNQNQVLMGKSYSQMETRMPLIPEIESMEKIRTCEIWIDAMLVTSSMGKWGGQLKTKREIQDYMILEL